MKRLKHALRDWHPAEEVEIIDRWNESHFLEVHDAISIYGEYFVFSENENTKSYKLA